ncbi:hypothetical protein [Paraburkholderia phenoliruptrix]|uniref:hypothetical protein n=1 Tax=Paraburkholderia phenoliruptrix TaxID=252970 RepID=UPI001C6EF500|nr:hypothetical protein [Paraburkholderia phenoliruptrix]MBW9102918.1 hypothetical protein [Paraburkholderia phenoliruptrix]MBW9132892.1 hypothetical protein [Paraburkholderia ginsengiterrae]
MKRLASIIFFASECAAAYLWQIAHFEAAGRVLIFYYWVIAVLLLIVGAFTMLGALALKRRDAFPTEGVVSRISSWGMLIVRIGLLVAVSHQVLAAVYLFAYLLFRFAIAIYRDIPEAT